MHEVIHSLGNLPGSYIETAQKNLSSGAFKGTLSSSESGN